MKLKKARANYMDRQFAIREAPLGMAADSGAEAFIMMEMWNHQMFDCRPVEFEICLETANGEVMVDQQGSAIVGGIYLTGVLICTTATDNLSSNDQMRRQHHSVQRAAARVLGTSIKSTPAEPRQAAVLVAAELCQDGAPTAMDFRAQMA